MSAKTRQAASPNVKTLKNNAVPFPLKASHHHTTREKKCQALLLFSGQIFENFLIFSVSIILADGGREIVPVRHGRTPVTGKLPCLKAVYSGVTAEAHKGMAQTVEREAAAPTVNKLSRRKIKKVHRLH
jgi:hypothetical protein